MPAASCGPVREMGDAVTNPRSGYQARLIEAVGERFRFPPSHSADWRSFDRDLTYLASLGLSQGRDAAGLGKAVVLALRDAVDADDAARRLSRELTRDPSDYEVVLVVDGATSVLDAKAFGFEPAGPTWGSSEQCSFDLRKFLNRQRSNGPCAPVVRRVRAHDPYAAYALALGPAEELVAYLVAEHRVNDIRLRRPALVLDHGSETVVDMPRLPRAAGRARALNRRPLPELSDSLRHYARARGERAPSLAVRDTWVALEGVANGAERILANGASKTYPAGSFLPPHAAAATVLAAARNQLVALWQHLRDTAPAVDASRWSDIRRWLGVPRFERHVSLRRFQRLVAAADGQTSAPDRLAPEATVEEAGAALIYLVQALGPYSRQRVAEVQERLTNAERLGDWCVLVDRRAQLQLRRMKFLRHRVVHRAAFEDATLQLAVAAHDLADAVFEVLPHFMRDTNAKPWEALRATKEHRDRLMSQWRRAGSSAPVFNPERLVRP